MTPPAIRYKKILGNKPIIAIFQLSFLHFCSKSYTCFKIGLSLGDNLFVFAKFLLY